MDRPPPFSSQSKSTFSHTNSAPKLPITEKLSTKTPNFARVKWRAVSILARAVFEISGPARQNFNTQRVGIFEFSTFHIVITMSHHSGYETR